jgi:nucleotide-binding universal stress UspA family protein
LKKEIEDAFAQVFRAREEAEQLANQKRQDITSREQAFRAAFREHRKRIIKPTLESLKQLLEKNGIDATVVESEVSSGGGSTEPSIAFYAFSDDARMVTGTRRQSDANVQLQLSCHAQKGSVGVYVSRPSSGGRSAGPEADAPLESVTEEWIQKIVLSLLTRQ